MQFLIALICGLICASAVSAASITEDQMKQLKEKMEKCVVESGVDPALLERTRAGEEIDDEKLNCFGGCLLKAIGILDEEGQIHPEVATEMIPDSISKEVAMELITSCSERKGANICETASYIFKCIQEKKGFELFKMPPT